MARKRRGGVALFLLQGCLTLVHRGEGSGDLPLRSRSGLHALIHSRGVCRWKDRPAGECYRGGAEPEEQSGAPGKGT